MVLPVVLLCRRSQAETFFVVLAGWMERRREMEMICRAQSLRRRLPGKVVLLQHFQYVKSTETA